MLTLRRRQADAGGRLLVLNFTDQADPGDHDALVAATGAVGLDGAEARTVLTADRYAAQVRAEEALWQSRGINSMPAVIVNDPYLISSGQPPEEFERQLRAIASRSEEMVGT